MGNQPSAPIGDAPTVAPAQRLVEGVEALWGAVPATGPPGCRATAGDIVQIAGEPTLVVCGGNGLEDEFDDVWSFSSGPWRRHDPDGRKPKPRGGHTAVATPEGVVVFGGISHEKGGYLADVALLSPDQTAWLPVCATGELPCARDKHSAVFIPSTNQMLVFGGFGVKPPEEEDEDEDEGEDGKDGEDGEERGDGDEVEDVSEGEGEGEGDGEGEEHPAKGPSVDMTWFSDTYALEVSSMRWTKLALGKGKPAPVARAAHGACLLDSSTGAALLVFGGRGSEGRLNDTWVLDGVDGVAAVGGAAVGGRGSAAGGGAAAGEETNSPPSLSEGVRSGSSVIKWVQPVMVGQPPSARSFHACVSLGRKGRNGAALAAIYGGLDADANHLNDLHLLQAAEDAWSWVRVKQAGALPSPRGCFVLSLAPSDELVLFGGSSDWSSSGATTYHHDTYVLRLQEVFTALSAPLSAPLVASATAAPAQPKPRADAAAPTAAVPLRRSSSGR